MENIDFSRKISTNEQDLITPPSSPVRHDFSSIHPSPSVLISPRKIPDVITSLQSVLKPYNYAFTGGVALYLWAKEFNIPFNRSLKDVDIVTTEPLLRFRPLIGASTLPGPDTTNITGSISTLKIDVIKSKTNMGNMDNSVTLKSGIRLLDPKSLLKNKQFQAEDEIHVNLSAYQKDITLLNTILNLYEKNKVAYPKDQPADNKRSLEDTSLQEHPSPPYKVNRTLNFKK